MKMKVTEEARKVVMQAWRTLENRIMLLEQENMALKCNSANRISFVIFYKPTGEYWRAPGFGLSPNIADAKRYETRELAEHWIREANAERECEVREQPPAVQREAGAVLSKDFLALVADDRYSSEAVGAALRHRLRLGTLYEAPAADHGELLARTDEAAISDPVAYNRSLFKSLATALRGVGR